MSLIIDALKRVQKAKIEGGDRDKKFKAKTILFPSGNSRKRRFFLSKKILFPVILLSLPVAFLLLSKTPDTKKNGQKKLEISMPAKTLPDDMHAEIPSGIESQGPDLIILPSAETGKKEEVAAREAPARQNKVKLKPEATTPERVLAAIKKPARQNKVKLKPESAASHFNLGVSYQEEGKLKRAREEYEKVISIEPLNVEAYNNLGMVYKDLGELDRAIAHYRQAVALDPRYEKAHSNMAVALYLKGDLKAAVSESRLAIALNSSDITNYNNLGLIYKKSNRPYEAIESFLKVLAIDPGYPPAHYNLALLLEDEGRTKEAIFHYQKFIELSRSRNNWELRKKVAKHIESLGHALD